MEYNIVYEKNALRNLAQIDKSQQKMIVSWIEKNLKGTTEPRRYGSPLKGSLKDYWRYRVGTYRIIAKINDNDIEIIFVNIQHRKDIYK